DLPPDFRQSTDKLERNFIVSAVIFKKYVPIFKSIFRAPSEEPPRVHRSRKQRRHPCTVTEVFNFCWVLFVHAKGNFPMISDDLVNSYHLLLCALDLVFTNALLCNARKDLLNPEFKGLPEDFGTKDFRPASGPFCFMEQLCRLHDGLVLEAKGVKEHFWKPFIKKLFHKRILRGKEDSLTGFLDPMNFGDSLLALSRLYEEHVLATGSLDERIFTGEGASEDIGTPGPCLCEGAENQNSATFRLHTSLAASALKVSTPLTGRKYVQEGSLASPLSSAMKSVGRLHTLLSGTKQGPSAKLAETLRSCARDPSNAISRRLNDMFDVFSQHYEDGATDGGRAMGKDMAVKYFHLAEALYYRILESVIEREKMILGDADLSCILEQDIFHRSLLACCLEIVIFSVCVFQVMPPQYLEQQDESSSGSVPVTPVSHGAELSSSSTLKGVSPSPTTLLDRYSSPPASTARRRLFVDPVDSEPGLASSGSASTAVAKPTQASLVTAIPAGQTVVTMATATVTANNGQTVTIPVQGIANESGGITFIPVQVSVTGQAGAALQPLPPQALAGTIAVQPATVKPAPKPAGGALRKGSLSLFFRKVYHLASVRLRDLCARLDIMPELRRKIWTCFEYSLVHCTDMMMDRHLDQLLMCAVYVMAKVSQVLHRRDNELRDEGRCSETHKEDEQVQFRKARALCPYPSVRTGSPRRMLLSSKHSIYISPHKAGSAPSLMTPREKIHYYICSSPPNRLQEINSMIRTGETPTRKRGMALEEGASPKRVCPDSNALMRRLQDVANDRSSSQ
ncbi:retinoblastoma-like protein 2, partial [Neolamprologus brichardi]|uniref:retinoblastoma-like protein 2 n=1 Tax=Neolamprologus brichardi TaxID=32507 RepID=UPI0016439815